MARRASLLLPLLAVLGLLAVAWWGTGAPQPRAEGHPVRPPARPDAQERALPEPVSASPPTPAPLQAAGAPPESSHPAPHASAAADEPPRLLLHVRHAGGEPAAHALVLLARDEQVHARAETDAQGQALLDGLHGSADAWIAGATWQPVRHPLDAAQGEHEIVLPAGAVLAGRVLVNGRVPGEPVTLGLQPAAAVPDWLPASLLLRTSGRFGVSGASAFRTTVGGAFHLSGLPEGWEGAIETSWALPFGERRRHSLPVRAPARDLLLELVRLPVFFGRFVDEQASPVPGAHYELLLSHDSGETGFGRLLADDQGRFEIPLTSETRNAIRLTARDPSGRLSARLEAGPVEGFADHDLGDVVLRFEHDLLLRVVDRSGAPIAGARALERLVGAPRSSRPTSQDGTVAVTLHGDTRSLTVLAASHFATEVALPDPPPRELTVVLDACACLTIRVQPPIGRPLPDRLAVRLTSDGPLFPETGGHFLPAGRYDVDPYLRPEARRGGVRSKGAAAQVDPETGQAQPGWLLLPVGEHPTFVPCVQAGVVLSITLLDRYGHRLDAREIVVQQGEQRDLVLSAAVEAVDWQVRVRDEAGAPVPGAQVSAMVGGAGTMFFQVSEPADGEGMLVLPDVHATRMDLSVFAEDDATLDLPDVSPPAAGAVLELVLRRAEEAVAPDERSSAGG